MLGVAFAITILVSVQGFFRGFERALDRGIAGLGYEVLVTAKGCPYEAATLVLTGGNIPMYLDESVARQVLERPEVKASTRLFMQARRDVEENRTFVFVGIEDTFRELKPWLELQLGGWFSSPHAAEVILGYNVADRLRLTVGDSLEVAGLARPLRVVGLWDRTGAQDDGALFLPLAYAQKAFDRKDKLTGLGIKLEPPESLETFIAAVQDLPSLQIITLTQARGALLNLMGAARTLMTALAILTLVVAIGGLLNTVLASVFERMRELAILKIMGAGAGRLFAAVCLESSFLCLGGALLGYLLACALGGVLEGVLRQVLPFVPAGKVVVIGAQEFGTSLLLGLGLGLVASLLPALKAARTKPALTLQSFDA